MLPTDHVFVPRTIQPVSQGLIDLVNSGSYPDEPTDEAEILKETEDDEEDDEDE